MKIVSVMTRDLGRCTVMLAEHVLDLTIFLLFQMTRNIALVFPATLYEGLVNKRTTNTKFGSRCKMTNGHCYADTASSGSFI